LVTQLRSPRNKNNARHPGAYQLATQGSITTINAGDELNFKQFITGYGEISDAKIQAYFSAEVFDEDKSSVRQGLIFEKHDELHFPVGWGNTITKLDSKGFCAQLTGIPFPEGGPPSFVFDSNVDSSSNRIFTELEGDYAPFEFTLKVKKNASHGTHYLDFYLTYFNGQAWSISKERVEFKINNQFEKHSGLLSLLAAAALIVTIAHDGLGPLIEYAHNIGKFVSCWRLLP